MDDPQRISQPTSRLRHTVSYAVFQTQSNPIKPIKEHGAHVKGTVYQAQGHPGRTHAVIVEDTTQPRRSQRGKNSPRHGVTRTREQMGTGERSPRRAAEAARAHETQHARQSAGATAPEEGHGPVRRRHKVNGGGGRCPSPPSLRTPLPGPFPILRGQGSVHGITIASSISF